MSLGVTSRACLLATLAALAAGCPREHPRPTSPPPLPRAWSYEVHLDQALSRADVELCFTGSRPQELRAGKDAAAIYLESAHWLSPGPSRKLAVRGGKVQLAGQPAEGCLRYRVDLERAAGQGFDLVTRRGEALMTGTGTWLWRPERFHRDARATLRLHLPPGVRASLPWKPVNGRIELRAPDFRYRAYAAFGQFDPVQVPAAGVEVSLAMVGGTLSLPPDAIKQWLTTVVGAVADVPGRFPTEYLQLIAINQGARSTPVSFGTVGRGGGASVALFMSSEVDADALTRHWVLPHELSHLLLPFVREEDAWLSEGVATYYQEVVRARADLKSERGAWGALLRTTRSATRWGTGRTLARESQDMHRTYSYERVYWAGAALALMIDARLRHTTKGECSLDRAIERAPWWRGRVRTWRASEVLAALDAACGTNVVRPLCEPALASVQFPAVAPLFEQLGVREVGGRIELDDSAPWADVRRAIMTPRDGRTLP